MHLPPLCAHLVWGPEGAGVEAAADAVDAGGPSLPAGAPISVEAGSAVGSRAESFAGGLLAQATSSKAAKG